MIGMWGSTRAGKTTYLIALYYEVLQRKESEDDRWVMRGKSDAANNLIEDGYKLFVSQNFPQNTLSEADLQPLRFQIVRPGLGQAVAIAKRVRFRLLAMFLDFLRQISEGGSDSTDIEIDLFDPSGELFREPARLMGDIDQQAASYRTMLSNSSGLLCMIDPDREDNEHYFPLIFRNFVNLSELMNGPGGGPLPIPVAICVTKCDRYPEAFANPRAFLRERMGLAAFSALTDYCAKREFFAVSAIGHDNLVTDAQGNARPKGEPKPINVLQPIEWLTAVMR
jgi:hypothetical protein